jgi:patatin-like phospholipase/acyl hydrolase
MKKILSIDGGGIKGVFPAAFLATIEDTIGGTVADYFDLIVGTSTGGIIALGLGLGFSAKQLLDFYEQEDGKIFGGGRARRWLRHFRKPKYDPKPLATALKSRFGDRLLGESTKRLVIPSLNIATGEVHLWKTCNHPRLQLDYKCKVVEVALATSAAPTYFPTFQGETGIPLIDGGVWANNPIAVAVVEAIGILGWDRSEIDVLSLGCTSTPLDVDFLSAKGKLGWAPKIADVFMTAQASSALGMAQHLLVDRSQITRISPVVGPRYELDKVSEMPSLKGLDASEARKALPTIRERFFETFAEPFETCYARAKSEKR